MKEFQAVFQLSKTIIFEVKYYTLGTNKAPYFTTTASQFCRSKKDYCQCGQAQGSLLPPYPTAMRFFQKWDAFHLKRLNEVQYASLWVDLMELMHTYNYMYEQLGETQRPYTPHFEFQRLAEWSKQEPKKAA